MIEMFTADTDPVAALMRAMVKHPTKRIAGGYYWHGYLVIEIGA